MQNYIQKNNCANISPIMLNNITNIISYYITVFKHFCLMLIHIGNKIREIFDSRGITISEFARRINMSRENVYDIFKRKTIDTGLLQIISGILEHDFFQYYSQPVIETHKKEIERLKEENKLLKEVNELQKSKLNN